MVAAALHALAAAPTHHARNALTTPPQTSPTAPAMLDSTETVVTALSAPAAAPTRHARNAQQNPQLTSQSAPATLDSMETAAAVLHAPAAAPTRHARNAQQNPSQTSPSVLATLDSTETVVTAFSAPAAAPTRHARNAQQSPQLTYPSAPAMLDSTETVATALFVPAAAPTQHARNALTTPPQTSPSAPATLATLATVAAVPYAPLVTSTPRAPTNVNPIPRPIPQPVSATLGCQEMGDTVAHALLAPGAMAACNAPPAMLARSIPQQAARRMEHACHAHQVPTHQPWELRTSPRASPALRGPTLTSYPQTHPQPACHALWAPAPSSQALPACWTAQRCQATTSPSSAQCWPPYNYQHQNMTPRHSPPTYRLPFQRV